MAIAIVAATSREMRAALGFASGAPEVRRGRDEVWSLDDRQFVLSVTGIGVVNAALAMGRLLQRGGLDGVVNLGLAGAFDPRALPLRTPCLVRREIWPEIGLAGAGAVDPRGLGLAQGTVDGRPV
ncbi:MAG: futalosine hydrolase, partial [Desulfovibrionaceae bacterium]|nr:futalosine hydrolase [Desulfovibrionaceae bacterium]